MNLSNKKLSNILIPVGGIGLLFVAILFSIIQLGSISGPSPMIVSLRQIFPWVLPIALIFFGTGVLMFIIEKFTSPNIVESDRSKKYRTIGFRLGLIVIAIIVWIIYQLNQI